MSKIEYNRLIDDPIIEYEYLLLLGFKKSTMGKYTLFKDSNVVIVHDGDNRYSMFQVYFFNPNELDDKLVDDKYLRKYGRTNFHGLLGYKYIYDDLNNNYDSYGKYWTKAKKLQLRSNKIKRILNG